jgi:transcriptional regulator with XRE-family HTH domain
LSNLKRIRLWDKRISQVEFARRSGIHPSRICLLESGKATPSANEMKRISNALGMLPEEIFGLEVVAERLALSQKRGG